VAEIRQILAAIDRTTAKGARDAAIILLGFASAMRRSELAGLTLADVEVKPGGMLLNVRRSKTDQNGDGQVVAVAHGNHAVAALHARLEFRGMQPGPLFTRCRSSPRSRVRVGASRADSGSSREQQVRFGSQCPREGYALRLPAGQVPHRRPGKLTPIEVDTIYAAANAA